MTLPNSTGARRPGSCGGVLARLAIGKGYSVLYTEEGRPTLRDGETGLNWCNGKRFASGHKAWAGVKLKRGHGSEPTV